MPMRGDEVVESLDRQIKETIDKMVGEIRSSIQDVREAVDSQLEAALQSMQADVNAITFRPFLQKSIHAIEDGVPGPVAPPPPVIDAKTIRSAIQAVERGRNQVDVLNALLEQALGFGSRAALMILKGDAFAGWKGMGFTAHDGNDELIKRFVANPNTIPEFDRLSREEHVIAWNGVSFTARIGATPPARALLVPMVIKDKVAAALYIDVMPDNESKFDVAAIELLVFSTGLLIDTLAIRKKVPSPSLSSDQAEAAVRPPAPVTPPQTQVRAPEPRPAPAPVAPPRPAPPASAPVAPAPRPAVPPAPRAPAPDFGAFDMESVTPPTQREKPAAAGFGAPSFGGDLTPSPRPVPPPPAAPAEPGEKSSTQYIPPPGLQRGGAFGAQSEQGKKHDEARRFARLLVSEIKLYNEAKVEQGRKNRDLYERLKEDIDRSRQMYDERIPEEVRKTSNYFYEELVRILADNDSEALGL
jgi:hypothetical protein